MRATDKAVEEQKYREALEAYYYGRKAGEEDYLKNKGVCDPSSPYYDANECMVQTQQWRDENSLDAIEYGLQPTTESPEYYRILEGAREIEDEKKLDYADHLTPFKEGVYDMEYAPRSGFPDVSEPQLTPYDGSMSNCDIPFGLMYATPHQIYNSTNGRIFEFERPIQEHIANAFLDYYPEIKNYANPELPSEEAYGTPPVKIDQGVFISAHEVTINKQSVYTMYVQESDTITLHIVEQSPLGDWESIEKVGEIKELPSDCSN